MEENKELGMAWKFIEDTNVSVFLTGKAGTGKTTFLKKLREQMQKRMVVVAPTGVAAITANRHPCAWEHSEDREAVFHDEQHEEKHHAYARPADYR